jgi:hypothetical protein
MRMAQRMITLRGPMIRLRSGLPHFRQTQASDETSLLQSGHAMRATDGSYLMLEEAGKPARRITKLPGKSASGGVSRAKPPLREVLVSQTSRRDPPRHRRAALRKRRADFPGVDHAEASSLNYAPAEPETCRRPPRPPSYQSAQYVALPLSPFFVSVFSASAPAKGLAHLFLGMPSATRMASAFAPGCDRTYFTIMPRAKARSSALRRFPSGGTSLAPPFRGRPGLFFTGDAGERPPVLDRRSSRDTLRSACTTPSANFAARSWIVSEKVGIGKR